MSFLKKLRVDNLDALGSIMATWSEQYMVIGALLGNLQIKDLVGHGSMIIMDILVMYLLWWEQK
jgi:hypothetical protein